MPTQDETQTVQGLPGPRGVSVHHTRWTATTNPEGHFGVTGHMDTYTLYGDEDETVVLGWFSVKNGEDGADPFEHAVKGGFEGTREEFYNNFAENAKSIEELRDIVAHAEALFEQVEAKGEDFAGELEEIIEEFNTGLENKIGVPGGIAPLDENNLIPEIHLPETVRSVVRVNSYDALPIEGELEQLYLVVVDETVENEGPPGPFASTLYLWSGYAYLPVTDSATANQLKVILELLDGLTESKADRGDYDATIEALQEAVSGLDENLQTLAEEKATTEEVAAVQTALETAVEELNAVIEAVLVVAQKKQVVEVDCYCDLPEEGEEEVIYVVTKDEKRANVLSLYYWNNEAYHYFGGSSVETLEGQGTASEVSISHVWNTTSSKISAGTPLMLAGNTVEGLPGARPLLLAADEAIPKYLGIALKDIEANTQGTVAHSGVVRQFDTTAGGEDWVVGDALYFRGNGAGVLTNTEHVDELYKQPVGYVLHVSPTEGIVYLAHTPFRFGQGTGEGGGDGNGAPGKSAYEIAQDSGFEGTEQEWLSSLKGEPGEAGKSAYESAVEGGFEGTETEWAEIVNGADGTDGKSAYEIAVEEGFIGTVEEWLGSLKGETGPRGKSAYESAVEEGFEGTESEWAAVVNGADGVDGIDGIDGKSAYEVAVDNGFTGTEQEWIANQEKGQDAYDWGNHAEAGYVHQSQVLQALGTSSEDIMSQAAVTEAIGRIPSVSASSAVTLTLEHRGKCLDTTANVTVPSGVFSVGDVVSIAVNKAAAITVTPATGVTLRIAGTSDTGAFQLEEWGMVTLRMTATNNWRVIGVGIV